MYHRALCVIGASATGSAAMQNSLDRKGEGGRLGLSEFQCLRREMSADNESRRLIDLKATDYA